MPVHVQYGLRGNRKRPGTGWRGILRLDVLGKAAGSGRVVDGKRRLSTAFAGRLRPVPLNLVQILHNEECRPLLQRCFGFPDDRLRGSRPVLEELDDHLLELGKLRPSAQRRHQGTRAYR